MQRVFLFAFFGDRIYEPDYLPFLAKESYEAFFFEVSKAEVPKRFEG